ncbi:MAG: ABC transporter permease [bacterium]
MKLIPTIQTGVRNLRRYPLRTILSILGIVIGIFAVSLTVSLGNAVQDFVLEQITSFGTGIVTVNPKLPGSSLIGTATARVQGIEATTLKRADVEAFKLFPFAEEVAAYSTAQQWAVYGNKEKSLFIIAATAGYLAIDGQAVLEQGRFYSDSEERAGKKLVVLGSSAREKFFGAGSGIGEYVRIGNATYEVIGSFKPRGASFGFNLDDLAIVPLKAAQQSFLGVDYVSEGGIKLKPGITEAEAAIYMENLLRRRHGITDPKKDDFVTTTMDSTIDTAKLVTSIMSFLLVMLASISLLVGGIGIMNIMLVSVKERLHEIGVRKAFGARDADLFKQFMIESITLTSLGGAFGIILALLGILLATLGMKYAGFSLNLGFPIDAVLIAIGVAAFVGTVFGIYPATKAAKMSAIEALRAE